MDAKEGKRGERTSLSDSDEISILKTDRNGLTLNGTRSLVSDGLDDVEDGERDLGFSPRTHREGNRSSWKTRREEESTERELLEIIKTVVQTARSDTEILPEDTPVTILHLVEWLVAPVSLIRSRLVR